MLLLLFHVECAPKLGPSKRLSLKQAFEAGTKQDVSVEPAKKKRGAYKLFVDELPAANPSASSSGAVAEQDRHDVGRKFYQHIMDMWLRNHESAKFVQTLSKLAGDAGAHGVKRIAAVGAGGRHQKNSARDLMRLALRNVVMPDPYWAPIPCWNAEIGKLENIQLPFLLAHELLYSLVSTQGIAISDLSTPPSSQLSHLKDAVVSSLGVDGANHILLGLFGDGVPVQRRGSTMEVLTLNFVCCPLMERMLWSCLERPYFCKCGCSGRHTLDPMLELLNWSLRHLLLGIWPASRHDKSPWGRDDQRRSHLKGSLGFTASLCQVRGDWSWYKSVFSFAGWAGALVCWLCGATDKNGDAPYTDVGPNAEWRKRRWGAGTFAQMLQAKGKTLSPLLSAPGMSLRYVAIDVLHALDLGFSCDVLGSFFWILVRDRAFFHGASQDKRVTELWAEIKRRYRVWETECRIQGLTREMILQKKPNATPKLRTKGAETRHLVPIALGLAQSYADAVSTEMSRTIVSMLSRLVDFYMLLGVRPFALDKCKAASLECVVLYKALHDTQESGSVTLWPLKPKIHMFQELAEFVVEVLGDPADFWNYRDESFVGFIATMSASRGGGRGPATMPLNALNRWRVSATL